jgi:hypothetical protein
MKDVTMKNSSQGPAQWLACGVNIPHAIAEIMGMNESL